MVGNISGRAVRGDFATQGGHLIMSGDILNYHNLVWVDATGIYFVLYTAKHPVMHRKAPDNRNQPA